MAILELPPETVIQILDYVGSSYFRLDLSRLTVCRQWTKFAFTACYREFYITQKILRHLLCSPYVNISLPLIKDSMEILDLSLKGFEDWEPVPLSRHDSQAGNVPDASTWDSAHGLALRTAWSKELDADLVRIATISRQSQKLRIIRIQATSELHPLLRSLERRDYLFLSTIRAFLSSSNLTSLELDLCGTQLLTHHDQEHGEEVHICTTIATLLATLRRLRLRMRSLCTDVLKPRQCSTSLRLDEMLINLSLSNESPLITSAAHTTRCGSVSGESLQLKADMEEQAQVLVAQMAAPKIVRILTHALPSLKLRAFDVLTSKTVMLNEDAEWDDDGESIEDEVSDEESEISSLSSDNDG